MRSSFLVAALTVVVAACGTDGGSTTTPTTTTIAGQSTTSISQHTASSRAELAIADLASHLNIDPVAIQLVSEEDVSWSDGSIGCPEPGMAYTQAIVPGYLIILEAADTEYRYHGATHQDPFRCDRVALNPVLP